MYKMEPMEEDIVEPIIDDILYKSRTIDHLEKLFIDSNTNKIVNKPYIITRVGNKMPLLYYVVFKGCEISNNKTVVNNIMKIITYLLDRGVSPVYKPSFRKYLLNMVEGCSVRYVNRIYNFLMEYISQHYLQDVDVTGPRNTRIDLSEYNIMSRIADKNGMETVYQGIDKRPPETVKKGKINFERKLKELSSASIPKHLTEQDLKFINTWLEDIPEIKYIVLERITKVKDLKSIMEDFDTLFKIENVNENIFDEDNNQLLWKSIMNTIIGNIDTAYQLSDKSQDRLKAKYYSKLFKSVMDKYSMTPEEYFDPINKTSIINMSEFNREFYCIMYSYYVDYPKMFGLKRRRTLSYD